MQVKTSELTGAALDWAVAKCENMLGYYVQPNEKRGTTKWEVLPCTRRYSTNWIHGGPIIDREKIAIRPHVHDTQHWSADRPLIAFNERLSSFSTGDTALIAAMRCFVLSKLGNVVDIPDELV